MGNNFYKFATKTVRKYSDYTTYDFTLEQAQLQGRGPVFIVLGTQYNGKPIAGHRIVLTDR